MNTFKCGGYSNYETWNMCVWIDNEKQPCLYKIKCLKLLLDSDNINAETVRKICLEIYPNGTPDMNETELHRVDYEDIARAWSQEIIS